MDISAYVRTEGTVNQAVSLKLVFASEGRADDHCFKVHVVGALYRGRRTREVRQDQCFNFSWGHREKQGIGPMRRGIIDDLQSPPMRNQP